MCGCKFKSKAVLHLCVLLDADNAQDSSTKERSARSMGERSPWIPANSTANTCILKLVISNLPYEVLAFEYGRWGLGSLAATCGAVLEGFCRTFSFWK